MSKYNEKLVDDLLSEMDRKIKEIQELREWAIETNNTYVEDYESDYWKARSIRDGFERQIAKQGDDLSVYNDYHEKWKNLKLFVDIDMNEGHEEDDYIEEDY